MNRASSMRHRRHEHGTTMIEVLVTIVVVSIGLLGYAGLLANGQKSNLTAYWHAQATMQAYDIIECMRANRAEAVTTAAYNIGVGVAAAGSTVAKSDLIRWKAALASALPSGDGGVTVTLDGKATIDIRWTIDGGTVKKFVTETQL